MATKIVSWYWKFGDGSSSTDMVPDHIYMNPGTYSVDLKIVDEFGIELTFYGLYVVRISEYPIGVNGLISGYSDYCIRHAVKNEQGCGMTPFNGKWIWPMILRGTAKGYNLLHEHLSLIINTEDMRIYQIGIPELWTDRAGTYDEAEIPCEGMLPEITSRYGEHENVRHVETHASMRSYDERRYRGKEGYTADGFRKEHKLSIEVFENGEQIAPASLLYDVNHNGDYAFLKEIEAKRFQLKLKYATSAFRTTRIETHCQEIDHRTPPQLNDIPQKRWQKEFSSPDIWFSRNKPNINTNRGDGTVWAGGGIALAGPDGKSASAFIAAGLMGVTGYTIADFMVSGWMLGNGTLWNGAIAGGGNVWVRVIAGVLEFSDTFDTVSIPLLSTGAWELLTAIRRGNKIELYENGRLKIEQAISTIRSYGGITIIGNGSVFDIRRNTKAISGDAVYDYYQGVLAGGGGYLP